MRLQSSLEAKKYEQNKPSCTAESRSLFYFYKCDVEGKKNSTQCTNACDSVLNGCAMTPSYVIRDIFTCVASV